ncbi:Mu-like prophage major head subunit gpT family protein [Mesorhizobium sp. M1423]|uniref:prohead protease/major capsid protein fusion protein n=1 Tax=Mesorhizobium sp. M1423 TaxID=2957101 RepID=UPI00333D4C8C
MNAITRKQTAEETRRESRFRPRSLNEDDLTVDAVIATQTPVRRWYGYEVLRCNSDAIDASRIVGMPVLDSHNSSTVGAILGRVESYRIEGSKLIASLRFADSTRGREVFALVRDGMLSRVSVGYTIEEQKESKGSDGTSVLTATRWMPAEVSLVGVPADHNAKIRGIPKMAKAARRAAAVPPEDIEDDIDDDAGAPPARQTRSNAGQTISRQVERSIERVRQRSIEAGVAEADIDEALEDVDSTEEARTRAFELLARRGNQTRTGPNRGESNNDRIDSVRVAAVDALAVRLGSASLQIQNNELAGRSVAGIFRTMLDASGVSTRNMDDVRVIDEALHGTRSGMHSTSDFPALFIDAGQRVLNEVFQSAQSPLKALSRKRNARDFRPVAMIRPGGFPKHQKVLETGEIKYGTFDIENEAFSVLSFAIAISFSRQMMVNDDLGVIADVIQQAGNSAISDEGDLFYKLISENGFGGRKLSDNKNFFHADHGNLAAAGSALDVTSLSAARQAMRLQKGVDGRTNAGAAPSVLLVGPALETTAQQLVATLTAATVDGVNPFSGKLTVEVENLYGTGKGWWLFADAKSRPAFVHGYLEGFQEGPRIRTDEPFGRQGMSFSSEFDFGCGVYDYRAAYFNPGVA